MKKNIIICTLAGLVLSLAFTACKKNDPKQEPTDPTPQVNPADTTQPTPPDTIPASFPKKHLIEEFTGQTCGYCPEGMNSISDFTKGESNWVLILHHYGYEQDNFSVAGSKTIQTALGVNGAPKICINRASTNYGKGNDILFHPGYLPQTSKSQFATETYASVVIDNTYDPATRQLNVTVSGALCKEDYPALQLTVLVKESGMIDTQEDYYYTFGGWEQFRHTNAVRLYLSDAKGDAISVDSTRHYTATYTATLNDQWVPENCMVVAFLSEAFKPVIQAEQQPVVAGSAGGADITHGGIKAVEVPDYYPEVDATSGPSDFSGNETESLAVTNAFYKDFPEKNARFWQLQTYSATMVATIGKTQCAPFADLYVITDIGVDSIPAGDYPLNLSEQPGTAYAGYRDNEKIEMGGSVFYFVSYTYLMQGYVSPVCQWLIVNGTLTVDKDRKWSLTGHTLNGSRISLKSTSAIKVVGAVNAPIHKARKAAQEPDKLISL